MFTGLVEKIVEIEDFILNSNGAKVVIDACFDVKDGASVSLNGICLTFRNEKNKLVADIMKESLNSSNLKELKKGSIVNLERAMTLSDRLDGHIVTGHIDNIAKVVSIKNEGFSKVIKFNCDTDLIVKKGSIAINGVSLTVSNVEKNYFEVSLIPSTIENTNLKCLKENDTVNIEYDIIGKYIKKFFSPKSEITMDFLKENGF